MMKQKLLRICKQRVINVADSAEYYVIMLNYYQTLILISKMPIDVTPGLMMMSGAASFALFPLFSLLQPISYFCREFAILYFNEYLDLNDNLLGNNFNRYLYAYIARIGVLGVSAVFVMMLVPILLYFLKHCSSNPERKNKLSRIQTWLSFKIAWFFCTNGFGGSMILLFYFLTASIYEYRDARGFMYTICVSLILCFFAIIIIFGYHFFLKNLADVIIHGEKQGLISVIMYQGLRQTSFVSLLYYYLLFIKRSVEIVLFMLTVLLYTEFGLFLGFQRKLTNSAYVLGAIQFIHIIISLLWMSYLVMYMPWKSRRVNNVDILTQLSCIIFQIIQFTHGSTILVWNLYTNTLNILLFIPFANLIVLSFNLLHLA